MSSAIVVEWPKGILITNDDGPPGRYSPFLLSFCRALSTRIHQLKSPAAASSVSMGTKMYVCVPARQQSWVAKSISRFDRVHAWANYDLRALMPEADHTVDRSGRHAVGGKKVRVATNPVEPGDNTVVSMESGELDADKIVEQSGIALWGFVDGSAATAANIAITQMCPFDHPKDLQLVISGPNFGRNTGRSFMLSSGTVGAAMEGALQGVRSISLSYAFFHMRHSDEEIEQASQTAVDVVLRLWAHWPTDDGGVDLFNVNVPLGSGANPDILTTHVLQETYSALFRPVSVEDIDGDHHSTDDDKHHNDPKRLNRMIQATASQHVEFRFGCDFSIQTAINTVRDKNTVYGSDLWAVKNLKVSVTPLKCTLKEFDSEKLPYPRASQ